MVRFRFRFDPRDNESFNLGLDNGVPSVATLVCATLTILQPSSLNISCNLNSNQNIYGGLQIDIFYFDNDIEPPRDDRRLSISTVNRQIYRDKIHICAVNFRRRRGGTVLKQIRIYHRFR